MLNKIFNNKKEHDLFNEDEKLTNLEGDRNEINVVGKPIDFKKLFTVIAFGGIVLAVGGIVFYLQTSKKEVVEVEVDKAYEEQYTRAEKSAYDFNNERRNFY